jgi:predicted RNase H-like HicB family nuclease
MTEETPHYSMVIAWSDEDRAYVVTVPELPGCKSHGKTYEEAARQGEDAIATWIEGAIEDGEPLPAPRTYETYSLAGA